MATQVRWRDPRHDFPRSCYTRGGKPKRRYATQAEADRVVRDITELNGERVNSYECWCCGAWHVGHTPEWLT